ncbi:MAG TPA: hypothetical protein VFO00_06655 [Vitreimonas sp.]|nr:hypothetical protein [Vitreimonas sp.]
MADLASSVLGWLAVVAMLLGAGAAAAVLWARSLFSACVGLAALCTCAGAALLALGFADGAVVVGLLGGAIAPVLLLGGVVLTSRSVKPTAWRLPWLSILAAALAALAMMWGVPALDLQQQIQEPRGGASVALAALVFTAVAACVALLGYGERGVLAAREDRDA